MRAICISAPGELSLIEVDEPTAGEHEAVVDVAYAGICASDVEVHAGRRAPSLVRYPVTPGHEWSGTVSAVGAAVDPGMLGRKVVGEGFRSCGSCPSCRRGDTTLCGTYDETGFTAPGAWAEKLRLPARLLHVLDDNADLRSAAGLEPAACAADGVRRADVQPGQRVAVVGGGTIGLLTTQLLAKRQLAALVVVEPSERRAGQARRFGAHATLSPEQAAEHCGSFDVVIEAAGAEAAAQLAVDLAAKDGSVVLAGMFTSTARIRACDLVQKRLAVQTVFGAGQKSWYEALDAFRSGTLDPGGLVTHVLDLARAAEALALVAAGDPGVGKVLLTPRGAE